MPPINLVLGLAALRPTEVGGTVGGLSPSLTVISLPLPPSEHALLLARQLATVDNCQEYGKLLSATDSGSSTKWNDKTKPAMEKWHASSRFS